MPTGEYNRIVLDTNWYDFSKEEDPTEEQLRLKEQPINFSIEKVECQYCNIDSAISKFSLDKYPKEDYRKYRDYRRYLVQKYTPECAILYNDEYPVGVCKRHAKELGEKLIAWSNENET